MSHQSIILIENDVNLRQSIALILQRAGYLVTTSNCADMVLELLRSGKYQLIISDVDLPEIRNNLLPKVLGVLPHLPMVILTDQSSTEAQFVKNQIRARYLIKPVAPERLLDAVHSILENHNSTRNTDYLSSGDHS